MCWSLLQVQHRSDWSRLGASTSMWAFARRSPDWTGCSPGSRRRRCWCLSSICWWPARRRGRIPAPVCTRNTCSDGRSRSRGRYDLSPSSPGSRRDISPRHQSFATWACSARRAMPMPPLCPDKWFPRPEALAATRTRLARPRRSVRTPSRRREGVRPRPAESCAGAGGWLEGTLGLKVPISGPLAGSSLLVSGWHRGSEGRVSLLEWELLA